MRGQTAPERAAERAGRQFGVVARRQMLESGFRPARIQRWIQTGRLHRRYPGVYAWGRSDLSVEGELAAALLYAGSGSALACITALWWMGLLGRRPAETWIDAPRRVRPYPFLQVRRPRKLRRNPHRGLPVVPLPDALIPAASILSGDALRLVLARAEFRGLLSLHSLHATLGSGRVGSVALRAAIDAHLPQLARCANGFERDFVLLCERFCLPLPDPNPRIGRYRPDMLWREAMLIVELDGRDAHHTAAQRGADRRRQSDLEALGYTVLRFGSADVHRRPEWVAAEVGGQLRG